MSRVWTNTWLSAGCVALVFAAGAVAHAAQTLRIVPLVHDNQVLVSFEVAEGYTNDVRDAISSVGDHRVHPPLDAPATGESILKAIEAVRAEVMGAHQ